MTDGIAVVVHSKNERKLSEYRSLLAALPVRVVTPHDVLGDEGIAIEEGGDPGLEGTATHRALAVSRATGLIAIVEVFGLEVAALGGKPGMRLAHFAHERATDAENNAALLSALEAVQDPERGACLRCVVAVVSPFARDGVALVEGRCEGRIARAARGSGGFGYEPLFIVDELGGRALAELEEAERHEFSPRARALRALGPKLARMLDDGIDQAERIAG